MTGPAAYLLERAWVDGAVRDDVLVDDRGRAVRVGGGRQRNSRLSGELRPTTDVHPGSRDPTPRRPRARGPHDPGAGERPQPRVPPCAAGADPARAGHVLDVARADVRRRGPARPRQLLRTGPGGVPRDGRGRIHGVGEFHYLHHQPDGTPYDDADAMGRALSAAAGEAGIRITLLDTCYLSSGFGSPAEGVQRRFGDGDRRAVGGVAPATRPGGAIHSVRAVPRDQLVHVVPRPGPAARAPLASSAPRTTTASRRTAPTPTQLLARRRRCSARGTRAVHATHLTDDDVALLGRPARTSASPRRPSATSATASARRAGCARPGAGSARERQPRGHRPLRGDARPGDRRAAGHAAAGPLDRRRAARRRHGTRGWLGVDAGAIAVGARADLVTLDTAARARPAPGADEHTAVFAATAADVTHVIVDGERGLHERGRRGRSGRELDEAIGALWT